MLLYHLTVIAFAFLTLRTLAVDPPRSKDAKSQKTKNDKRPAGPNVEDARVALNLVAERSYRIYNENMQHRADVLNKATKIREPIQHEWEGAPSPMRKEYRSYQNEGDAAFERASKAAKTNRLIASTIKNIRTTHKPRWNDFRRWGHSAWHSEFEQISLPTGVSYGYSSFGRPSIPYASSRTYSSAPAQNPWRLNGYRYSVHGRRYGWPALHRTLKHSSERNTAGKLRFGSRGTRSSQSLGGISIVPSQNRGRTSTSLQPEHPDHRAKGPERSGKKGLCKCRRKRSRSKPALCQEVAPQY